MQLKLPSLIGLLVVVTWSSVRPAMAQTQEESTIRAAELVLSQTMASPLNRIPQAMMANAHGVAIIPNVIKGGFIVGARHGRGVLMVRQPDGVWNTPVFITLTGGNIGWQIGVQSSDIVLVFRTAKSVQGVLNGRLTIGADAAAAAGPVGRQAAVATDGHLQAEIYAYSRSRGLFAGVSVDGSVVRVDHSATNIFYGGSVAGQPAEIPPSALRLTQAVANYAQGFGPTAGDTQPARPLDTEPGDAVASGPDAIRDRLRQAAPGLFESLDESWREFLSLPEAVLAGSDHPTAATLAAAVENFDSVAANPQFQALTGRADFQTVHGLLRKYQQSLTATAPVINLPPPPAANPSSDSSLLPPR